MLPARDFLPAILAGCLALLAGCSRPNDGGLVDSVGEQKANAEVATRTLLFDNAILLPGTLEDRVDASGPRIESVAGPRTIAANEPFSFRLTVPREAVGTTFALLQWKYAESFLRIPIEVDPLSGTGLITASGPQTDNGLVGVVDGALHLESNLGRPGPGIPVAYEPAATGGSAGLVVLSAHSGATQAVEMFERNGDYLMATGGDDALATLWSIETGHRLHTLSGHSSAVTSLAARQDGSQLATGSRDHTVRLWDTHTGALLATLGDHRDTVTGTSYSPDGRLLATSSWDGTVQIYELGQAGVSKRLDVGQRVSMVRFSNDGALLGVASGAMFQKGQIAVLNVADWSLRFWMEMDREVTALCFSDTADRVAAAVGRGRVYVWDVASGDRVAALLDGPADTVPRLGFWPGHPRTLAGLALTGVMFLWDTETGQLQGQLHARLRLTSTDFSNDGTLLALGDSRGTVRLVEIPAVQ